jgi:hypothetical protein
MKFGWDCGRCHGHPIRYTAHKERDFYLSAGAVKVTWRQNSNLKHDDQMD